VLPACLAIVLAVSLAIGSGLGRGHRSAAQRAASIEAQIRCPSCEDLSVLQSSTSAAVSVRNQIAADIARGWPDGRIEQALVARYGSTILLRPPTSGLTSVVWLVPAVAGAAALLTVGLLFWRRGRTIAVLRRQVSP
jgi:cytochrome c-type biogenesis protein CcmH